MANFRYSHLYTTKTGSAAVAAAGDKLNQAEIALAIAKGGEMVLFKNNNGEVVTISSDSQIMEIINNLQTVLSGAIEQEITDRIADVDSEEARAEAAEVALSGAIETEETRAKGVEAELDERIATIESGSTQALNDEIARAMAAEAALSGAIDDEAAERTSAYTALLSALEAEVLNRAADVDAEESRAEAAEAALSGAIDSVDGKIDQEIANRMAGAVASVDYDSTAKTIDFYNANNVKIDSIDATDFIKDGMIDSVSIETTGGTSYLVIVWNTDAGKETTRIDIGDLFEADNYYTKDEVDDIVSGLTEVIYENERVTSEALNDLNSRISGAADAISAETEARILADTAEATARANADVVSAAVDSSMGITLTLGDGSTITTTQPQEITLSAGEF